MVLFLSDPFNVLAQIILVLLSLSKNVIVVKTLGDLRTEFSQSRLVQPTIHHARTKREISTTRYSVGLHYPEVTIKVDIDDEEHLLDLKLNEDLISNGHVISYQKNGKIVHHKPTKEELDICQYSGSVRDKPGSWVAVSTCHGIRGVIFDGRVTRYITPGGNTLSPNHYIHDHQELNSTHKCGNIDKKLILRKRYYPDKQRIIRNKRDTRIRGPYSSNGLSRYVELVLVADTSIYNTYNDIHTVHKYMKHLANIINSLYTPLNIFIVLVGVEVWTERNEIQISSDSSVTLKQFSEYRYKQLRSNNMVYNDNAHFLTAFQEEFDGSVVGEAYVGKMCSTSSSAGVATFRPEVIERVGATVAHEMGHNFGLNHDEGECKCPGNSCLMAGGFPSDTPRTWSNCSKESLTSLLHHGIEYCLRNKPERLFGSPTCGNGFVERGEECDCGLSTVGDQPCYYCCDPQTCKFRKHATCATGECCDLEKCRPKPRGVVCRKALMECDLPEYCNGHTEFCPKDVFKMDSTPCGKDHKAYCANGLCQSHDDQCRLLWGHTAKKGQKLCYDKNLHGNMYGNCGYADGTKSYRACSPQDMECGMLHCEKLKSEKLQFSVAAPVVLSSYEYTRGKKVFCDRVIFQNLGTSVLDPGLVPDGAKCGNNKMCFKQRCIDVDDKKQFKPKYDDESFGCPSDCNGHGICNSEGHCHCDDGFEPPTCNTPGSGGSIDSGPASDPHVLHDFMVAMYIIFLGILPFILLLLVLVYYVRHKHLPFKNLFTSNTPAPKILRNVSTELNDSTKHNGAPKIKVKINTDIRSQNSKNYDNNIKENDERHLRIDRPGAQTSTRKLTKHDIIILDNGCNLDSANHEPKALYISDNLLANKELRSPAPLITKPIVSIDRKLKSSVPQIDKKPPPNVPQIDRKTPSIVPQIDRKPTPVLPQIDGKATPIEPQIYRKPTPILSQIDKKPIPIVPEVDRKPTPNVPQINRKPHKINVRQGVASTENAGSANELLNVLAARRKYYDQSENSQ